MGPETPRLGTTRAKGGRETSDRAGVAGDAREERCDTGSRGDEREKKGGSAPWGTRERSAVRAVGRGTGKDQRRARDRGRGARRLAMEAGSGTRRHLGAQRGGS